VTTLNSFYASANALSNLDQRRWALGAAYRLGEYTRFGYSISAARALVLAAPQYANGLTAAGLTAAYNAVDDVGGGAFAPTDLGASLLAWWKADSLALANAAPVTSWTDSSGNARTLTQATGANQPVFSTTQVNGLPAVTFDGTNDYLATAAFASPTSGASVFAVQKLTAANQYRTVLSHAAAATWVSPFARVLLRVTDDASGDRWQWIVEDAGVAGNAIVTAAATTAAWQIVEGHYDQANQDIVVAGAGAATQVRTGALTSSTQPVFVGADTSLADNFSGQITELVYCSSLNATQRGQVRSYLQGRAAL
jgi:NAD(P)H-dependent FMN reductase